jgi:peptide deformylase
MNILQAPLKIVQYPHPSLRHKARPVTFITEEVRYVASAMLELMYEHRGLGLAAPQVGLPFQMFVANYAGDPEQRELEGVFINPEIIEKKGGMVEAEEGCLSFPKLFQKVRRSKIATVEAYNLKGERIKMVLSDLPARIWQHEVDHLHGELFIDKLGPIGRLASRRSLREFERDHRKAQERGDLPSDVEIEKRLRELEEVSFLQTAAAKAEAT